MGLIAELETTPRGVYTGAIGFVAPGRRAQWNVAIRTVRIDKKAGMAEYGTGGGIVWDSTADSELEECRVKARILTRRLPAFHLLETILWTPGGGLFLLERHLDRLEESAAAFAFPVNREAIHRQLLDAVRSLPPVPHRVRLTVPKEGRPLLEMAPLTPLPAPFLVKLALEPVEPTNPLLYHKTTRRELYEQARQACPEAQDVLLWNPKGELTESSIANVLVEIDGVWFTPPLSCGLLGGVYRAELLARGTIREHPILVSELTPTSRIRLINSVRGEWDVCFSLRCQ
jgi:para-aminobenzoate synthetase/4-amino-4-deoxychorismate lyase